MLWGLQFLRSREPSKHGAKNAFSNLTSVEGGVYLIGQKTKVSPNGGVLTISGDLELG